MKYHDSVAKSTEFLGPALALMAKQTAPLDPVSYAIWYEYVAGKNVALKDAIDEHLVKGELIDEITTYHLFNRHVADIDGVVVQRVSEGFQKVIAEMSSSVAQAGDQAGQFGSALEKWRTKQSSSVGDQQDVAFILGLTRTMEGSIASLKGRLDESRQEIETLRQEVGKAREDALADGLTGLTNRRGFDIGIAACLSDSGIAPCGPSLIMADIDHFKQVNDTYGHVFGDKVIKAVAQILKNNVKGRDTAARYGGEEFVVLLPATPVEGARRLAESIRAMVEKVRIKRASDDWAAANISISLGVAGFKPGESATEFVARTDVALYASKAAGRNQVTVART
jgi:diguanylate cyclase